MIDLQLALSHASQLDDQKYGISKRWKQIAYRTFLGKHIPFWLAKILSTKINKRTYYYYSRNYYDTQTKKVVWIGGFLPIGDLIPAPTYFLLFVKGFIIFRKKHLQLHASNSKLDSLK